MSDTNKIKLTIDDTEIEVERGTSVLQAAEQIGIEIPRFCYHDKLSVPANCRMCLVEVSPGPPKPGASCAMACGEGMVVKTNSEMVKKARKGVMEMLLINHPLDCPICDQGGECDLQDQAMGYGFDRSRFEENKRAVPNKELGPLIDTVMTRCINCTRCVRFAEEIAGTPTVGQFFRGEDAEIGTFIDQLVDTELSGNLVDICPVGALTSKPYKFKARPWELRKTESIDVHDAVGSNIRVDSKGREVMRVLPRLHEDINEEWINDKTRHACDGLQKNRLDRPYIRDKDSGKLVEATWDAAFDYIAEKLDGVRGDQIAGLVGDLADLESIVALKDFLQSYGSPHMDCRTDGAKFDPSNRAGYLFNSTITGIEKADAILIVGANPRHEASLVNARIRKNWLENRTKIGVIGEDVDLTYKVEYLGATPADLEKLMRSRSGFAKVLKDAKNPIIIVGNGAFIREDGAAVHALMHKAAEKFGAKLSVLHGVASRVGALEVGFVPDDGGLDFGGILAASKKGKLRAVYLLGADEFDAHKMIGWKTFVIYQGHHGDHGAARADVILPSCAYTEKDGTYVNIEGRPQLARRAVSAPAQAKEDWTILRALSARVGKTLPYNTGGQLHERIIREWDHLGDYDVVTPAEWGAFGDAKGKIDIDSPFINAMDAKGFYLSNAIARGSDTMRDCTAAFTGDNDVKVAAE